MLERAGMRFWQKVLGALLVVGVLPIVLVSVVSIRDTRGQLIDLGVTNIRERSVSTANAIDAYLQSRLGDIVLVSKLPDIVNYSGNLADPSARQAARTALKAASERAPEYESVAVVNPNGDITAASIQTDEGTSVKFRQYFITAFAGTPYISDPSYSVITNRPALFFSAPVKDATGKILSVVRTRVNLAAVWDIVEGDADSVGAGAHSFLVDDYGIRLAVSETKGRRDKAESLIYKPIAPIDAATAKTLADDRRFGQLKPEQLVIDPLPSLVTSLGGLRSGGQSAAFAYGEGVSEQRGVVTKLSTKPWAYTLAVPIATYTRAADDSTFNAVTIVILGLLLSFVIGVWLTRSLVTPLRRLVLQATLVSTGNVDLRVAHFDTQRGDDITREVASAFDRLLNALRFYALADDAEAGGGGLTEE